MRVICTFTIDRPVFFPFFFSPFLSPTADLNGIDDRDEWYDLEKAGVVPRCDNSRLLRRGISQPRKTRTPALGTATMHPPTSEVGPTWRWRVTSGVWVLGHKGNIVYVANAGAVLAAGAGLRSCRDHLGCLIDPHLHSNSRVTRIRREDFIDVVILASKSYFSKIPGNGNAIGKWLDGNLERFITM